MIEHSAPREEHWTIVDLIGNGVHVRTVPVPDWVKSAIDLWTLAGSIKNGRLLRGRMGPERSGASE